jgi:NADH-quinone oxidoreductase subunit C
MVEFHEKKSLEEMGEYIKTLINSDLIEWKIDKNHGVITTYVDSIVRVISLIKDDKNLLFTQLIDLFGVDFDKRKPRFDVVYEFLSTHHNQRIRIKVSIDDSTKVPTITNVFKAAPWYEREAYDMYGILFDGNNDLRRILTDYHFDGHPLRKDFPLSGYVETDFDEESREVVYKKLDLKQEYRNFDDMSPWEGDWKDLLKNEGKESEKKDG